MIKVTHHKKGKRVKIFMFIQDDFLTLKVPTEIVLYNLQNVACSKQLMHIFAYIID